MKRRVLEDWNLFPLTSLHKATNKAVYMEAMPAGMERVTCVAHKNAGLGHRMRQFRLVSTHETNKAALLQL